MTASGRLSGTSSAEGQARDRATNQTEPAKTEPGKKK